jgi:pimeloyl-ACP methyl ester carboxylesterase
MAIDLSLTREGSMMTTSTMTQTTHLQRPEGRIAYDVRGDGPLVVCVPGMGDLRSAYRTLAPALAQAGYRVVTMDLRGHGDSDATFSAYDDVATGTDILALIAHLGGPAVVVGNSMGGGAAAWAAAEDPAAVAGIALLDAFVRNPPASALKRAVFRLALARPWGRAVWPLAYRSLHTTKAPDLAEHVDRIAASLRRPGHWRAFAATTRTSHAPVEARLSEITCPALVVMGEQDPDFADPAAEANLTAERIRGARVVMVPEAGHYPMVEQPAAVTPPVLELLADAFASR